MLYSTPSKQAKSKLKSISIQLRNQLFSACTSFSSFSCIVRDIEVRNPPHCWLRQTVLPYHCLLCLYCLQTPPAAGRPFLLLLDVVGLENMHACNLTLSKFLNFGTVAGKRFSFKCSTRKVHMEINHQSEARGALIVLEGLDRSGKTSQSGRLLSNLAGLGYPVESWRFPDRDTAVGQMISSYLSNKSQLDDHTIHLLFSANRWEKRSLMEAKLKSGTSLIVDRYSYSGVAFSAAKGLDIEWCKAPEVGLLAPDLVVYLDIPPEKAAERGGYGGERYEQLEFQKNVARHYKMLSDASWKMIDACLPMEDVEKQLKEMVLDCVTSCQKGKSVSQLWLS